MELVLAVVVLFEGTHSCNWGGYLVNPNKLIDVCVNGLLLAQKQ